MKKVVLILLATLIFACMLLCITSCFDNVNGGVTNTPQNLSVAKERLQVLSSQSPTLKYVCSDGKTGVYVYHIGQIYNVPISYGAAHYYDGSSELEITYTGTNLTEEAVASSKSSSITSTVSYISEEVITEQREDGVTVGINVLDAVNVSGVYNVKTTTQNKTAVGSGGSYSYSDAYEMSRTFTASQGQTIKYVLGEKNEPNYYYRLTLFALCDVYAFAAYDSVNETLSVSFDLSVNQSSLYYAIDKSDVSTFPATNAYQSKLAFDTEILKSSNLFDYRWYYDVSYELMGGAMTEPLHGTYTPEGILLPIPEREYYEFGGWYYDSSFTEQATASKLAENPSDVTLYAKWEPVVWHLSVGRDFEMRKGRDYLGRDGFVWQLDKGYLEQYQNDGYMIQITLHYEVVRYGGDYSSGEAYIAVALQDSNDVVDVSSIEYSLKSETFGLSDSHKIYEGEITATTTPDTFYVKKLCMLFDCHNDDILGGVLPSADDFYTVTKDTYIEISFVKA